MSFWKSLADCIARRGRGRGGGRGGGEKAAPIDPALQRRLHRVRQGLPQPDRGQGIAVEPFAQSRRPVTQAPGLLRKKAMVEALPVSGIVRHPPVALLGAAECQEGIERCPPQAEVLVKTDPGCAGAFIVTLQDGTLIGRIGARSTLARAIADADAVLGARITRIGAEDGKGQLLAPRITVVTGPGDARPDMAWLENHDVHSVKLSGEQHFQKAIRKLALGEGVTLTSVTVRDHAEGAIVAVNTLADRLLLAASISRATLTEAMTKSAGGRDFQGGWQQRDSFEALEVALSLATPELVGPMEVAAAISV